MKNKVSRWVRNLEQIEFGDLRVSLIFLIFSSIFISIGLVIFSMYLYNQSGAAQLDLSRPVYEDVRSQAWKSERFSGFDEGTKLNAESLDGFEEMFKEKRDELRGYAEDFNPADINDETLGIIVE